MTARQNKKGAGATTDRDVLGIASAEFCPSPNQIASAAERDEVTNTK